MANLIGGRTSRSHGRIRSILLIILGVGSVLSCKAQVASGSTAQKQAQPEESGTSTDLFVMLGSDFDRPGWVPEANYNIGIGHTRVTGYTWVQIGITSYTGAPQVQNRFYDGESLGAIVHFTKHSSIWIQETFNKIVTVPWYTTSSIGYTWSW
jgi:hypothetical protein